MNNLFKINYRININGEEFSNSHPSPDDEKFNVFKFQGQNEQGKTTVLKIVALAFGALEQDDDTISPEIKEEIGHYNEDYVNLSYEFTITSPNNKLTIAFSREDGENSYFIDGKPVAKSQIREQFIVLFDVPEKLETKMKNSVKDVKNRLDRYKKTAQDRQARLVTIHEQLNNYRNAEQTKRGIETTISNLKNDLENYKSLEERYAEEERLARKRFVCFEFKRLENEFYQTDVLHKEVQNNIKEYNNSDKKSSKAGKKLVDAGDELRQLIYDARFTYLKYGDEGDKKEFKGLLENLKRLSHIETIDENTLREFSSYFNRIDSKISEEKKGDAGDSKYREKQELELINKLINIVNDYSNINPEVPGSGKRLMELLQPLESRRELLREILGKSESIQEIGGSNGKITAQIGTVFVLLKEYTAKRKDSTDEEESVDIDSLKKKEVNLQSKLESLAKSLSQLEDEHDVIPEAEREKYYLDSGAKEDYEGIRGKHEGVSTKIQTAKNNINAQEIALKRYEDITAPKTNKTLEEVSEENSKLERLIHKLEDYLRKLDNIDFSGLKNKDANDGSSFLYERIGEYLASVVGAVYHRRKALKLSKIDFQNQEYVLEDESRIKFLQFGTGTKSLNSLLGKIKQDFQGKVNIIIIDEIGNIDLDNQNVLISEILGQINNGEAILSLITERKDDLEKLKVVPFD